MSGLVRYLLVLCLACYSGNPFQYWKCSVVITCICRVFFRQGTLRATRDVTPRATRPSPSNRASQSHHIPPIRPITMSITTLTEPGDTDTHSQSEKVRAELKAWEKSFAAANEGRKAGRQDIKQNPEIGWYPPRLRQCIEGGI